MTKGILYLIPSSLGNHELQLTLPAQVFDVINHVDYYIVENIKSAAAFLKQAGIKKKLQELSFRVLNIDTKDDELYGYLNPAIEGSNMGIISEAGCPCIADPGAKIVSMAHEKGIKVVPLTGPSSIILSLMASGLNGQTFTFHGYLPIDKKKRREKLLQLEKEVLPGGITQIFIEAPHRNDKLISDITETCNPALKLCIAVDLTLPEESIKTKTIKDWKTNLPVTGKKPAIFLIGI
jgi:16S rRNA (cytidine1402-2'-O)-methyltransferase